jgi:predicted Zn-dependent peptidase
LGDLPEGRPPRQIPAPPGPETLRILVENRPIAQTHLSLGLEGPGAHDPDRHAMVLLCTLLGGNASSRLFQDLRERRGWCYQVGSFGQVFTDCGMLNISIALDDKNLGRTLEILVRHLEGLCRDGCRASELRQAREYLVGTSSLSLERTSSQNSRVALSAMIYGRMVPWEDWEARLRRVTLEDIQRVARRFLDLTRLCIAAVGPKVNEAGIRQFLG